MGQEMKELDRNYTVEVDTANERLVERDPEAIRRREHL